MNAEILAMLKESSTLSLVNELLDLRKVIQYCPKRQV
jgi:FtsZ-binding cell division protein ZapB